MLNRLLTGLALTVSLLFGAPRALAGDDAPAALCRVNVASGETTNATLMITPPNVRPFPSIVLARQERSCEPGG